MKAHRAEKHKKRLAQQPPPEEHNTTFDWTNERGDDDSRPEGRSLRLRLAHIGDRWLRGLYCSVTDPDGVEYTSPRLIPVNDGEWLLHYPEDFDAPRIKDGTYTVTWCGTSADDQEVIATRPILVREVVLSSFWKGNKPGTRLVLDASTANDVIQSGHGRYLREAQS